MPITVEQWLKSLVTRRDGHERYLINELPAEMRIEDTGLGIPRTEQVVMVQVTTRPRSRLEKQNFYELLCQELLQRCGVKASDVVVSMTQNADEDWSFGYGRAQFITGEL